MKSAKDRFVDKIKINDTSSCWEWAASMKTERYGAFNLDGKVQFAHRVSYKLFIGDIGSGMEVCHTCDNTKCVNPEHLFIGSHKDNMEDCAKKERLNNPQAKLTIANIRYIRARYSNGTTQADLCREFDYSTGSMNNIVSGKSWKHVT